MTTTLNHNRIAGKPTDSAPWVPPFAVATTPKRLPNRVILHATEGWGKTSFAAHAPNPIFLMTRGETGLWTLMNSGRLPEGIAHFPKPADSHSDVRTAIANLADHEHNYRALVIDTLNGVERLIHEQVCRERYDNDWGEYGFHGYDRGPRMAVPDVIDILTKLDKLRDKGMSILLLTHTTVATFKNPEGPDFDRYQPALHKHTWGEAHKWADIILFGARQTTVATASKKATKGKAQGGLARILHTERTAAFDAKNRHGLPPTIQCGCTAAQAWHNFVGVLKGHNQTQ
jgi:AAA domain